MAKKWKSCVWLPYGDGKGEQGLFFVAYTNNLSIIDAMLKQMFGTTGDGIHDRLLHFTTRLMGHIISHQVMNYSNRFYKLRENAISIVDICYI